MLWGMGVLAHACMWRGERAQGGEGSGLLCAAVYLCVCGVGGGAGQARGA